MALIRKVFTVLILTVIIGAGFIGIRVAFSLSESVPVVSPVSGSPCGLVFSLTFSSIVAASSSMTSPLLCTC